MRWTRNLLTRLLAPYLFALVAIAASLYVYGNRVAEDLYLDTLGDGLLGEARLAGQLLPWDLRGEGMDHYCAAVGTRIGARVTVIAEDGTVLGDSDAPSAQLENHREREEVRAALRDGDGHGVRLSASVNLPLFYRTWRQTRDDATAAPQQELRVIRLAVPMPTIEQARHRLRVAIWGGVGLAALAAFWPALVISRRLSRRVAHLSEFSNAVTEGREPPPGSLDDADVISRLEANLLAMANRLRTELQAAREEKGKLEAVLRGMVEGVLVIDRSATIRLSNQSADRLLGAAPGKSLAGAPLITMSRDPDLHELVREVARSEPGQTLVREFTFESSRGAEVFHVTATPIAELNGKHPLFILVFHDVTELKKLETMRRDFVANVSHELRTPLTAIRGYAETLQSGALNDPELARKFIDVIGRHSERLARLTDDLLTLSDLELGRTALRRVPTALGHVIDAAIEVLREKAGQAQVEIRRECAADLPALDADPDRIEQVLVNLLDNAVKYTRPGGRVTVGARITEPLHEQGSREWIELSVADTGVGVPKRDLPRLTERFYRVDKARSRELGGTGLGLAIVKHIVQAHGGALRIDSDLGRGTCVHVYLPAADSPPNLGAPERS